jgi:hypothetical protein
MDTIVLDFDYITSKINIFIEKNGRISSKIDPIQNKETMTHLQSYNKQTSQAISKWVSWGHQF